MRDFFAKAKAFAKRHDIRSISRDGVITITIAVVALLVLTASSWIVYTPLSPSPSHAKIIAQIASRQILGFQVTGTGPTTTVSYTYKGDKLPDKLALDEDVGLRTTSSYTRQLSQNSDGSYKYQSVTYGQPVFDKEADGWYYLLYDSASKTDFDAAQKQSPLSFLFIVHHAFATQLFDGAGDGYVVTSDSGAVSSCSGWTSDRTAASGSAAYPTTPTMFVSSSCSSAETCIKTDCYYTSSDAISRAFLPFDTSSIPAGANITAASLTVYATSTASSDGSSYAYITVIATTTQASNTTLVVADYSKDGVLTNPQEAVSSGQRLAYSSITPGNNYTFTLNATGIAAIIESGKTSTCGSGVTGFTCFGLRDGEDTTGNAPPNSYLASASYASFASSEAGTVEAPYLSVTYSSPFAPWQFWDF